MKLTRRDKRSPANRKALKAYRAVQRAQEAERIAKAEALQREQFSEWHVQVGATLRYWRECSGMKLSSVCAKACIPKERLPEIEAGKDIHTGEVLRLLKVFGRTVADLPPRTAPKKKEEPVVSKLILPAGVRR